VRTKLTCRIQITTRQSVLTPVPGGLKLFAIRLHGSLKYIVFNNEMTLTHPCTRIKDEDNEFKKLEAAFS
jgi:hypothetical protein